MNTKEIISLILQFNILKNVKRSGWALAGIRNAFSESVADHSWGTSLIALILNLAAKSQGEKVDTSKILTMAVIHDLPESILSDIPAATPLKEHEQFQEAKLDLENRAFEELISGFSEENGGQDLAEAWEEYRKGETKEAKIVKAADILDMLIQARFLESSGVPPAILDSFFVRSKESLKDCPFDFVISMCNELFRSHSALMTNQET